MSDSGLTGVSVNYTGVKIGNTFNFLAPNITGGKESPTRLLGGPGTLEVPWHSPSPHPSTFGLMSWHTRLADFSGRSHELTRLSEWALSKQPVGVAMICGEGAPL